MSAQRALVLALSFAFLIASLVLVRANTVDKAEAPEQLGPYPTGDGDSVRVLP